MRVRFARKRSLNVPGSPSSRLHCDERGRGARSPRTSFHARGRETGTAESAEVAAVHRCNDVVTARVPLHSPPNSGSHRAPVVSRICDASPVSSGLDRIGTAPPRPRWRMNGISADDGYRRRPRSDPTHGARDARACRARAVLRAGAAARSRRRARRAADSQTRTVSGGGGAAASLDDIELMVERRDLVDLGWAPCRSSVGERGQVRAETWPNASWMRCRCSISRSRRCGALPSTRRTSVQRGLFRPLVLGGGAQPVCRRHVPPPSGRSLFPVLESAPCNQSDAKP